LNEHRIVLILGVGMRTWYEFNLFCETEWCICGHEDMRHIDGNCMCGCQKFSKVQQHEYTEKIQDIVKLLMEKKLSKEFACIHCGENIRYDERFNFFGWFIPSNAQSLHCKKELK
jgi:hypothetical protein